MAFENSAGIGTRTNYGVRSINEKFGGKQASNVNQYVELVFNYNDLPAAGAEMEALIPADSLIKSAYLEVVTAFTATGTTPSINIGLYTTAGVAIDADGLFAGTLVSALTPAGKWVKGAGALIDAGIGANPGVVVVAGVGDTALTAGKARLVIEYIPGTV